MLFATIFKQTPDFGNLEQVLLWLAGVGGPYVVGYLLSLVAENWPAWHNFPKMVKFLVPAVLSVLIACGATLLLQQKDTLAVMAPWWTLIASAIMTYVGSQNAYIKAKSTNYGSKAKLVASARKYDERRDRISHG